MASGIALRPEVGAMYGPNRNAADKAGHGVTVRLTRPRFDKLVRTGLA